MNRSKGQLIKVMRFLNDNLKSVIRWKKKGKLLYTFVIK